MGRRAGVVSHVCKTGRRFGRLSAGYGNPGDRRDVLPSFTSPAPSLKQKLETRNDYNYFIIYYLGVYPEAEIPPC